MCSLEPCRGLEGRRVGGRWGGGGAGGEKREPGGGSVGCRLVIEREVRGGKGVWCGGGGGGGSREEEVFSSFVAAEGNEYRWRLFTSQGGRGENRLSVDSSLESSAQTMAGTENVCTVTTSVGGTYNYLISRLTAAVRQRACATDGHQSSGPQ